MTSRPGPLVARFIRQYSSAHGVRSALSPNGLTAWGTAAAAIPEVASTRVVYESGRELSTGVS